MSERGVLYRVIVFYSILIGGCRGIDSATCDDCTLCIVSNLQVQKICIPDGASLSNAIDIAFDAAKEGMAGRIAVVMRLP